MNKPKLIICSNEAGIIGISIYLNYILKNLFKNENIDINNLKFNIVAHGVKGDKKNNGNKITDLFNKPLVKFGIGNLICNLKKLNPYEMIYTNQEGCKEMIKDKLINNEVVIIFMKKKAIENTKIFNILKDIKNKTDLYILKSNIFNQNNNILFLLNLLILPVTKKKIIIDSSEIDDNYLKNIKKTLLMNLYNE